MTTRTRTTPTVTTLAAGPATATGSAHPGEERTAVHRSGRFGRILAAVRPAPAPRDPAEAPVVVRPAAPSVSARPTRVTGAVAPEGSTAGDAAPAADSEADGSSTESAPTSAAATDPSAAPVAAVLAGAIGVPQVAVTTTSMSTSTSTTQGTAANSVAPASVSSVGAAGSATTPMAALLPTTGSPSAGTAVGAPSLAGSAGAGAAEAATVTTATPTAGAVRAPRSSATAGGNLAATVGAVATAGAVATTDAVEPRPGRPPATTAGDAIAFAAAGGAGATLTATAPAAGTAAPFRPASDLRPMTTLMAHHGDVVTADGRGDLAIGSDPRATSQPSGEPVSTTTSWFGIDLATTITADQSHPSLLGSRGSSEAIGTAAAPPPSVAAATVVPTSAGGSGTGADTGGTRGGTTGTPGSDGEAVSSASLDPNALAAAGATAPTTSSDRPAAATPIPVGEQVARQISAIRTTADGTQRTVVRLDPEHLGPLTLTVSVRAGKVRLAVSGSPEALSALDASMNSLRDQLGSAGLGLDGISLQPTSLTGSGSSATDGRPGQSGAAFAATADSAADSGRRAPEERGQATGSRASDERGARARTGSAATAADPVPQTRGRNGSGSAGGVDVRI